MRLAPRLLALLAICALLVAGCGGSDDDGAKEAPRPEPQAKSSTAPPGASAEACESRAVDAQDLRATNISCEQARQLMFAWQRSEECSGKGGSRSSCSIKGSYRCLTANTGRGMAVSCAKPGRSVAFIVRKKR